MKEVYFDTNVYSHIRNRHYGITTADVVRLKSNVERYQLRIYVSSVLLEETTSAILTAEKEALDRLRLIYTLAKRNKVLAPYQDIIEGTIKAYITGMSPPGFLVSPPFRLRDVLITQSDKTISNLRELARESQRAIDKRTKESEAFFINLWPLVRQEKAKGTHESFEDYWNQHALYLVEKFSDFHGLLSECQAKGSLGLLELTAMKTIAVGVLSQGYANLYDKTTIARGDFPDVQHAVYASAVGTLVTHDEKFAKIMRRVPIDGLEILDIHSLLSQL